MRVLERADECKAFAVGRFVPTMGALHAGHGALIEAARRSDRGPLVVSIFVNPLQFGPAEDFERYPRPMEKDLQFCEERGVEAVFTPNAMEMYPSGHERIAAPADLAGGLCGRFRPGHFDGVVTAVARLFELLSPAEAYFGWKDAQQLIIVRRLAEERFPATRIVAVETVRESDGLALSSRNAYLSPEDRKKAPELYRALRKGREAALEGATAPETVGRVRRHLAGVSWEPEYVELRTVRDLEEVASGGVALRAAHGTLLLAAAARLGSTRLIDNVRISASRMESE